MENTATEKKLSKQQQALAILTGNLDQTISVPEAAKILKCNADHAYRVTKRVRNTALVAPSNQKTAVKTVLRLTQGKPVRAGGREPDPNVSLNAAKEILDRTHPKKQLHEHSGAVMVGVVDLAKYRLSSD